MMTGMKPKLVWLAKLAVSLTILAYLARQAWHDRSFADLVQQPKRWDLLAAALGANLAAVMLANHRWYVLVRALDLPLTRRDSQRLGFLGLFFTFLTFGTLGGDVLRALYVSREHPEKRVAATASVLVDRLIGMYSLFLSATAAFLVIHLPDPRVRQVFEAAAVITVIATIILGALLLPYPGIARGWDALSNLPLIGSLARKIHEAWQAYRARPCALLKAGALSFAVNLVCTVTVGLLAAGLPGSRPSWLAHFAIVPIAMLTNALPLPGGLGGFEAALDVLYRLAGDSDVLPGRGLIVALALRITAMVLAMIGAGYYVTGRRGRASATTRSFLVTAMSSSGNE